MDVTAFLNILPAPRAVFDRLGNDPEIRDRARFYVPAEPAGDASGSDTGWQAVTWGQFGDQIRAISMYLRCAGVAPGDRVAIYAPNRVTWAVAMLAIQSAGAVMVPVYPASTAEQLGYVLAHSDARVLFTATPALIERAASIRSRCPALTRIVGLDSGEIGPELIDWNDALAIGAVADEREPTAFQAGLEAIDLDTPGIMLYTSGTSGNPKGVPLTHRNVGANASDWLRCNGPLLDEDMVDLLWLPMSHVFGLGEMCLGNTLGFTTYMVTPQQALARMPEVAPSVFMSVPAYWEKIAQAVWAPEVGASLEARRDRLHQVTGGRLKFCLSGGAGLDRKVKELFHDCGLLIIEGYGLTECSPTLTLNRPDSFRFDSVGKALPSVALRLDEDGEILARGPNVFAGYHKDPEATAACFTDDGWFRTGDIGQFTDDGFLQIIDRKKDILVTAGGKNVPPANIELRFRDDPLIEHLVVYGDGKKYLVAGVWVNRGLGETTQGSAHESPQQSPQKSIESQVQARIDQVNAELARHESIKRFCLMDTPLTVESGLLTASLKIRRKHIYKAFRDQFEALYSPKGEGEGKSGGGKGEVSRG